MDIKPKTLEDWRQFMNGYRDPLTRAADREAIREYCRDEGLDFESYAGSGMMSGGDGARECGHRKEGGTYAVVPSSANGSPVDDFLLCKPMPIDREEYNLSNVGVRLVDVEQDCYLCGGAQTKGVKTCQKCYGTGKETVTHIFDIIGQEYYPNIADFVEEARRMGISRRLELEDSKQYSRLTSRSRLFLLHHRAIIENPMDLLYKMQTTELTRLNRAGCPKHLPEHQTQEHNDSLIAPPVKHTPGCSALYWNVLEEGAVSIPEFFNEDDNTDFCPSCFDAASNTMCMLCGGKGELVKDSRFVERQLKSGTYRGYALPEDVKLKTSLGVFAIFPLGRLEVVDPSGEYEDRFERASSAQVDVMQTEC